MPNRIPSVVPKQFRQLYNRFGKSTAVLIVAFAVAAGTAQWFLEQPIQSTGPAAGNPASSATFHQARVSKVVDTADSPDKLEVIMLSGPEKNRKVTAGVGAVITSLDTTPPAYAAGDRVLVSRETHDSPRPVHVVIDHYRLPAAAWLFMIVLGLAVIFAGIRGIGALLGLVLSIAVITQFIIPQVLAGHNPYVATAIGIVIISLVGMYPAHGFSRRTSLALAGTYITLLIAAAMSYAAITLMHLSGISGEDIFFLSQQKPVLNISGVLLCGTLISLIGILDDVTVGQASTVQELQAANPALGRRELYKRALNIGREHIASLINTLVLVYVGASLLFVVYISALSPYPLLVNLNSELIMEEIVRSLTGSVTLILAVPISTLLAARFLKPLRKDT
jgi:uncharacterized membrane protein